MAKVEAMVEHRLAAMLQSSFKGPGAAAGSRSGGGGGAGSKQRASARTNGGGCRSTARRRNDASAASRRGTRRANAQEAVFSVSPAEKIFTSNRFSCSGRKTSPIPVTTPVLTSQPLLHQLSSVASQDNATAAAGPQCLEGRSLSLRRRTPSRDTRKLSHQLRCIKWRHPPLRRSDQASGGDRISSGCHPRRQRSTGNFVSTKFAADAKLVLTAGPHASASLANGQAAGWSGIVRPGLHCASIRTSIALISTLPI